MGERNSVYARDWLRLAELDLSRVEAQLRNHDAADAGFHLQQAVEKFLKAFLLSNGWSLRRTHNLDALLDDAVSYDAALEEWRAACQRISGFYLVERYPLRGQVAPTEAQVLAALNNVRGLIERLPRSVP